MKWMLIIAGLLISPAWADGTPVLHDGTMTDMMIKDNTFYKGTTNRIIISNNMITDETISGIIMNGDYKDILIEGNTFYAIKPTLEQLDHERVQARDQAWEEWLRVRGYRK